MTKEQIIAELEHLKGRMDAADKYFSNLDLVEVDETKEWKVLKCLIVRAAYLQGLLNDLNNMERYNA